MGKNLPNQEKKISLQNGNPGCMYNILHVLNHHRWHRVKKMLPTKRNAATNAAGKHISDQGCSTATGEVTRMEKRINAETNIPSIEEKNTDQATSHHGTKTSMRSRLKALITEEMNKKRRSRHRRSSSYPARLHQLSRTNSIHHLEPSSQMLESLPELIATPLNNHDNIKHLNGESSPSSISKKEKHLLLQQNIMEKRRRGFLEPSRDTCVQETSQMLDALDVFDLRKEFLLKMLRDTSSPLAHYLNNNRQRAMKVGLTKSVSFPVPGATSPQTTTNEFKYSSVQNNADPPRTTTDQKEREEEEEEIIEEQKEECKGQDPNILKPILSTKVATKRFKYLRQKIKHVIKESRKERRRVTMDAVFHKIPYGRRFTKHSKDEKQNEIASCHKFSKMNTPAAPMRRSSSFNDGLSKYSRLLNYTSSSSNSKEEEKPQNIAPERERLKLKKKEVVDAPYRSPGDDRQALKRILSLPDLSSFLFLHGSDESLMKDPPDTTIRQASTGLDNASGEGSVAGDREKETPPEEELDNNSGTTAEGTASFDIDDHADDIEPSISSDSSNPYQEDTETLPSTRELIASNDESGMDVDLPTTDDTKINNTVDDDDGKMMETLPVFVEYDHLEVLLDSIQVDKAEFHYVKDVLERSGFSTGNELLGTWHSNYQPVNPLLFDQLVLEEEEGAQKSSSSSSYDHDQHLLLFDVINEVLLEIYERSFAYWPRPLTCRSQIHPMPVGYHVLEEVWWNINWYLRWRPETTELQSLDDAVSRDLAKGDGWMNIQFDAECVGLELEEMILDDLLDELLFEDLDLSLYC